MFMTRILPKQALLFAALLFPVPGLEAQDLLLLEEREREALQPAMIAPEQGIAPGSGQPAYTLRSFTRFGDRYKVTLLSRSGQTTTVSWRAGEPAPVGNSAGFAIASVGPGFVMLQHPPGDPCVIVPTAGVKCAAPDRSVLRLVVAPVP